MPDRSSDRTVSAIAATKACQTGEIVVQVSDIRSDPPGIPERVSVAHIRCVESRPHRVTVEWALDAQPTDRWSDAFDATVLDDGVLRSFVPSAYGRPMVMHDATIVWAIAPADLSTSLAFVERIVAHANARVGGIAVHPAAGRPDGTAA